MLIRSRRVRLGTRTIHTRAVCHRQFRIAVNVADIFDVHRLAVHCLDVHRLADGDPHAHRAPGACPRATGILRAR